MVKKGKFSLGALHGWEIGRFTGLTEAGARELSKTFQGEGVDCHPEWLLYGVGPDPLQDFQFIDLYKQQNMTEALKNQPLTPQNLIDTQLNLFRQFYDNAIDTIIPDNGLAPAYQQGDYVAGERYFGADIHQAINMPCIVQTDMGATLVRVIRQGDKPGLYHLECTEPSAKQQEQNNVCLHSAAPILWMCRKTQ